MLSSTLSIGAAFAMCRKSYGDTDENSGPGRSSRWEPGPGRAEDRDLTPGTTPIRFGTFLGRYLKLNNGQGITESIKNIRDNGFRGCFGDPGMILSMSDSQLRELNDALKKYDVVVFEIPGYTNMIHPDEPTRQKNLAEQARRFEAAAKVNCPMVGTITGSRDPVNHFNVHPDNWTLDTWKLTIQSIRQVLNDTAGMDVSLGMEAQVTTNLDSPLAHLRLMEDVGDPRCKVNLDPTNMVSLKNYYHTTELINECFDLLGENILGCHAKDTYIWPDKQTVHVQEVCPGRGVQDYETYLVRMSRLSWPRTLLPEHFPVEQIPEAFSYVKSVAGKAGVTIL